MGAIFLFLFLINYYYCCCCFDTLLLFKKFSLFNNRSLFDKLLLLLFEIGVVV